MTQAFDLAALHTALDRQRTTLGLTWQDVGGALGVSAGTLRGFGTRDRAEGDGVLRAVAWLGRSPESFVPGRTLGAGDAPLPPAAARTLRFDARALHAALEAERAKRGLTWRAVAAASGASIGGLTRLRSGGRVMFPEIMRVLTWLGVPAARFVRLAGR